MPSVGPVLCYAAAQAIAQASHSHQLIPAQSTADLGLAGRIHPSSIYTWGYTLSYTNIYKIFLTIIKIKQANH